MTWNRPCNPFSCSNQSPSCVHRAHCAEAPGLVNTLSLSLQIGAQASAHCVTSMDCVRYSSTGYRAVEKVLLIDYFRKPFLTIHSGVTNLRWCIEYKDCFG